MSVAMKNPFTAADPDRHAIWEMLVQRDIDAFLAQDWSMVGPDFIAEGFFGLDACRSPNPDSWRMRFTLESYRAEWLRQAADTASIVFAEDLRAGLFEATVLRDIDITGDIACAHKKFDGVLRRADGTRDLLNWQTLYVCRRIGWAWRIASFVGYMPHPIPGARSA
jgi:hypothetical protein